MSESGHPEVAILNAALELPAEQRAAYLDQACAGDAALRQQVDELLRAHEQARDFLEAPPTGIGLPRSGSAGATLTENPGDKIGRYKLLQQIGEGGCGVVFMAAQEEPVRRRVALKIIKLGMDTKQVIARFEAERQALALMDHPNIAKIFDAGITGSTESEIPNFKSQIHGGRPYFVMELVRGVKITEFCDENKLSTEERLKLFIQVCQAIQHAHQKGVIHRDIKPSNILVTVNDGVPVPKVIDFGIAKATAGRLTDQTLFTAFEQFLGTPAYMSPEQAVMTSLDIDTRSDIYSLGVLLYELLTGGPPFDQKELLAAGLDAMRRTIREVEPVKPSTRLTRELVVHDFRADSRRLLQEVRGDLDWIVMKCLEKDRTRRYETANGLARDIERHLNNEPVVACPPSRLYLLTKLMRRNKAIFTTVGAVTAALIFGLGLSTFLFLREARSSKIAKTEGQKSEEVARFLKDMLEGVGPAVALGRDTKLLQEILDKTAERVGNDLKNQPEVEAELRSTLGEIYTALARFQTAEEMHRRAFSLRTNLWGGQHLKVAETLDRLAQALWGQGRLAEAEAAEGSALTVRTQLLPRASSEVATSLNNLGVLLGEQGKLDQARLLLEESLTIQTNLFKGDHARIAETLVALANVLWKQRSLPEAERLNREALAMYRRMGKPEGPELARVLNNLGTVLRDQGDFATAEQVGNEALAIGRNVLGNAHPETGTSIYNLAGALWQVRKLNDAERLYREWLELPNRDPHQLAMTLNNLGTVLRDQGHFAEAITTHRRALAMQTGVVGQEVNAATSLHNLAGALWANGELKAAEESYRTLITNFTVLFTPEHPYVAMELNNLGTVLRDANRLPEAKAAHEQGLAIQRKLQDRLGEANSLNNLATVLLGQDRLEEATKTYQQSVAIFKEKAGPVSPSLSKPLRALAVLLQNAGKLQEAEDAARDCLAICEQHFTDEWVKSDAQSVLGGILTARRDDTNAEPLLVSGFNGLEQRASLIPANSKARVRQACERLILFYETSGQPEPANLWKQKLAALDATQRETTPAPR